MRERIRQELENHLALVRRASRELPDPIEAAARRMIACFERGGKVLVCGNGGSAADAQHFATELVVRYRRDRRALPALALTTDTSVLTAAANDNGFATVFERQIEALGRSGDLLLAISTSGESENVRRASEQALRQGMEVLGLTGERGGRLAAVLEKDPAALVLRVPGRNADEIQQLHILVLHLLCELVERTCMEESTEEEQRTK